MNWVSLVVKANRIASVGDGIPALPPARIIDVVDDEQVDEVVDQDVIASVGDGIPALPLARIIHVVDVEQVDEMVAQDVVESIADITEVAGGPAIQVALQVPINADGLLRGVGVDQDVSLSGVDAVALRGGGRGRGRGRGRGGRAAHGVVDPRMAWTPNLARILLEIRWENPFILQEFNRVRNNGDLTQAWETVAHHFNTAAALPRNAEFWIGEPREISARVSNGLIALI
jgi:hypothetical protein